MLPTAATVQPAVRAESVNFRSWPIRWESGKFGLITIRKSMRLISRRHPLYVTPTNVSSAVFVSVSAKSFQGVGVLGFANRGTEAIAIPAFNKKIAATECVNCGQCRVYCPTGAITIRSNRTDVWDALSDKDVRVVAQIAPAVRVAVGDHFGLPKGRSVMGKIVNVLHRMGFDEVYDTTFSADLTIMEESAEFLRRVEKGEKLPLLTSCCPAWVKFITDQYRDYIPNLSTCRSPQGMMSAVIKEYYRDPENAKGKKTVMVSIMPCTAKRQRQSGRTALPTVNRIQIWLSQQQN